jgi:hypothetical protein
MGAPGRGFPAGAGAEQDADMKSAKTSDIVPPDGPYQERFSDGGPACEGRYEGGRKIGTWRYYLANGA